MQVAALILSTIKMTNCSNDANINEIYQQKLKHYMLLDWLPIFPSHVLMYLPLFYKLRSHSWRTEYEL
jgi:hypothetical protein